MLFWTILSAWAEIPIPLHALSFCKDWRFPVATEEWIIGCSKKGEVDSIWFFETKKKMSLPVANQWLKGDAFFRVGIDGGFWNPEEETFSGPRIFAPPADAAGRVYQNFIVISTKDSVQILERKEGKTYTTEAKPMGYQLPVIVQEQVVWIEWAADKQELVFWDWKAQRKKRVIVEEALYLESEGSLLVWSEPQMIQILNIETNEKRSIKANSKGTLSIKDQRICWSEWQENETDIVCSDGFTLQRTGNQFSPIQLETGLIFQEEQGVMWIPF